MSRALVVVPALAAAACASSYQSARVLPPGKTEIGVSASRIEVSAEGEDASLWGGELQLRSGLGGRADGGFRLARTPGARENVSAAMVDLKLRMTGEASNATLSLGLPMGVAWAEQGPDWEDGALLFVPTVFLGLDLSPTAELVFAPKLVIILPDADTEESETEVGVSVGVRLTDERKSWAIQPELSLLQFSPGEEDITFVTFGLGISAGN